MNLPIPSTPPASVNGSTSVPSDQPAEAVETFGNLLARQIGTVPGDRLRRSGADIEAFIHGRKPEPITPTTDPGAVAQSALQAVILQGQATVSPADQPINMPSDSANDGDRQRNANLHLLLSGTANSIENRLPNERTISNEEKKPVANFNDTLAASSVAASLHREGLALQHSSLARIDSGLNQTEIQGTGMSREGIAQLPLPSTMASPALTRIDERPVIDTPIGSSRWNDEFSQKITWLSTQQEQSAELHLNPPDLGPLNVVLKVSGDQATALFTSPHAAVRDAVEQALPKLREMLADNGIMLGNASVNDQSRQESQQSYTPTRQSEESPAMTGSVNGTVLLPATAHNGMVDTFA